MSPTISAIITTYNYERFLVGAIESVLSQTRLPDEIIVVDDGSADTTRDTVARYEGRGVRYLWKENGGPGSARNAGIHASSGDLIAFLDADDRWLPDKLRLQVDHVTRYPSVGMVSGSEYWISSSRLEREQVGREPRGAVCLRDRLLAANILGNPSLVLVRRECFERVGTFDETLRLGQDWDMWIRIAHEFAVGIVDAPLIERHRHEASLSAGKIWQRYASNMLIQHRYIRRVEGAALRRRLFREAQGQNLFFTAAELVHDPSQRWMALLLCVASLALDPAFRSKQKVGVLLRAIMGNQMVDTLKRKAPPGGIE